MGARLGCITSQEGALGFFASFHTEPDVAYAVTCSHNMAPNYSSPLGQPAAGLADLCSVYLPRTPINRDFIVGHMIWAKTLTPSSAVDYDCAVARLSEGPLSEAAGIVVNKLWNADALPGSVLLVVGANAISGTLSSQQRCSHSLSLPGRDGLFTYSNLFAVTYVRTDPDTPATAEGMSGAPVVTTGGQLVGMHVAGLDDTGYFQRADEILKKLGMEPYLW